LMVSRASRSLWHASSFSSSLRRSARTKHTDTTHQTKPSMHTKAETHKPDASAQVNRSTHPLQRPSPSTLPTLT
jgi:hypothetical protein